MAASSTQASEPAPGGTTRPIGIPAANPAPETRRLYAGDWAHFAAWCRAHGHPALPASPSTLAAYLLALAPQAGRATLSRRRAAIAAQHRTHGQPVPLLDAASRAALRQACPRRPARPSTAPTPATLIHMAARTAHDLAGLRDRALLLVAAAAAASAEPVTQAALLGLDAEHVGLTQAGALLQLRARTDEAQPSRRLALPRSPASAICPVRALEEWLRASETAFGPVFRKVDRWGNAEHTRLAPGAWRRILVRHAARKGTVVPFTPA